MPLDDHPNPKVPIGRGVLVFVLIAMYVALFWGKAPMLLGEPIAAWSRLIKPSIDGLYPGRPLAWLLVHTGVGLAAPLLVAAALRRAPHEWGLGRPNALGVRFAVLAMLISVPFGLWLTASVGMTAAHPLDLVWLCSMLVLVPEHFLICGATVALLRPDLRLAEPRPPLACRSAPLIRMLHWLGFGRAPDDSGSWLGLARGDAVAILASGLLFGLVHVGKGHALELALSFPGGVAIAYLTVRSRSIWPAVMAHWSLNIAPEVLLRAGLTFA